MSNDTSLGTTDRGILLDQLERTSFDLLVIGGGITGAGVAREAALRGLSVALVEGQDFASGTSSRSSKLIHGGLRYLAMGDVNLVRETALERKRVHKMAPHLAEPLWMLAPARSRAQLMKFRTGITLYEKLGAVADPDRHRVWRGDELSENEPLLDQQIYPYVCAYREYLTDDVRLVLANLRGASGLGACIANHLAVDQILHESDRVVGVHAKCGITNRTLAIRANAVVNAAGPWVEGVMALDEGHSTQRLHLSKGIHIVVDRQRLPVRNLVIMSTEDRRSIFAIARGESVYIGTTDTSYPHAATVWPEISEEDVEYLLAPLAKTFKADPVGPQDVISAWSGLRPLIAMAGKQAKEISRRDEIWTGASGLITIAGGKLTGYRKMAASVVDRVVDVQGLPGASSARAHVDEEDAPLPGGDFAGDLQKLADSVSRESGLTASCADRLVRLYGAEAGAVASLGSDPVVAGGSVIGGEIGWAVDQEAAATLEDVIYRRTRAALFNAHESGALLEPVSLRLQSRFGWSEDERVTQVEAVSDRLRHDLAFQQHLRTGERSDAREETSSA
ncbi:MAG: glycerol-3-phosphate dehydrogenase/oxidase [Deltaproteobacteria bacterium]|nr:glycerol-3-phosphate dehydrogenase/oxidase [Deltaproteobacteria bacterium]